MNRIKALLLLLFSIILISCGTNENNQLSDYEKELIDLVENLYVKGEENQILDTSAADKTIEIANKIIGDWKIIKSEKGNFHIEFPDFEVKKGLTTQLLDQEEIIIYHYSINLQNESHINIGYLVDYSFWSNIKTKEQINERFDSQRNYILSATNSTLEYEKIIDTLSYPGRDLYFTIDDSSLKARYRMFFNNGIFYTLTVITEDGKHFNKSITRFLNSFKILENRQ